MIREATPHDLAGARGIFREYALWVGADICFQSFEKELAELPGRYAAPGGRLFLAFMDDALAGCAALREIQPHTGEMKRLYVRPAFRGTGLGRELVLTAIDAAKSLGYRALRLDTLPRMEQAIRMYQVLGFHQIQPYGDNPPSAICFELNLNLPPQPPNCV